MKKVYLSIIISLMLSFSAYAEKGINFGVSISGGVFEVDGATEKFTGAHSSSASPGNVTKKTSSEGENAEGLFAIGSIFIEKTLGDRFAIGVDYVPHSIDSETTENKQYDGNVTGVVGNGTLVTNTVQVDFEDLTTIYGTLSLNDNFYLKAGYMQVDVITNETLGTGGAYGNTDLDGYTIALGYDRELDNGKFVRLEGSYMDLDGASLTNTQDSTKSVSVDGITGYGAKLSIGKSF